MHTPPEWAFAQFENYSISFGSETLPMINHIQPKPPSCSPPGSSRGLLAEKPCNPRAACFRDLGTARCGRVARVVIGRLLAASWDGAGPQPELAGTGPSGLPLTALPAHAAGERCARQLLWRWEASLCRRLTVRL